MACAEGPSVRHFLIGTRGAIFWSMTTKLTKLPIKKANSEISDALRNRYFETLGLGIGTIQEILTRHGFSTECFDGVYCGNGRFSGDIGGGRTICFTWYRMESGRYEVVSYIS